MAKVVASAAHRRAADRFIGFKALLKMKAAELGFDYQDLGYTVLILLRVLIT